MAKRFKNEQDFVNYVLQEFAEEVIQQRIEQVKKTKSIASAGLLQSYRYEIRKATVQQAAVALFYFQESARFLDMKRMDMSQQRPIKAIKEWIKDKGLAAFRRLPEGNGRKPIGQDRILNDLAWGIVKKKKKKKRRKRRKLQKGWGNLIQDLIIELGAGYQDRTIDEIKEIFKATI